MNQSIPNNIRYTDPSGKYLNPSANKIPTGCALSHFRGHSEWVRDIPTVKEIFFVLFSPFVYTFGSRKKCNRCNDGLRTFTLTYHWSSLVGLLFSIAMCSSYRNVLHFNPRQRKSSTKTHRASICTQRRTFLYNNHKANEKGLLRFLLFKEKALAGLCISFSMRNLSSDYGYFYSHCNDITPV